MTFFISFQIDFFQMPVNTLRRYKRHYKLPARPGMNKAQLSDVRQVKTFKFENLGPVVQNFDSLMLSLSPQLVNYISTSKANTLLFFVEKM